jgi:Phosphotransferase enzyme family
VTLAVPAAERIAVARKITGDQQSELMDWDVEPVPHEAIIETTGGLYVVHGVSRGLGHSQHWTCIVKVLNRSYGEAEQPDAWCYWRREALFFSSGLGEALPASLRAPRSFGVTEHKDDCWVWMEHIGGRTIQHWTMDDYHRVAVASGEAAGDYLGGAPVPEEPWMAPSLLRSLMAEGGSWAELMNPDRPDSAWNTSLVGESYDAETRSRVLSLWDRRELFLSTLDALPHVFCHGDFHRRNLLLPMAADDCPVVLDWAFCGPGAVGADAAQLVAGTLYFGDVDVERSSLLATVVLDGYTEGLRKSGWDGDRRIVQLGFETYAAMWMGPTLPGWIALMLPESEGVNVEALYGRPASAVRDGWVTLNEIGLDLADRAESLARTLHLRG